MELIDRWKAKSPAFFVKAKKVAYSVGGSAIAVLVANKTFELGLNETLVSVIGYVVAVCAGVAGTAKLTKDQ